MNQAFSTAWIGFGWGDDISVEGSRPTDKFRLTIHRVKGDGRPFTWEGLPDGDGLLMVRISGQETANWRSGVMPVSLTIERGSGSGIAAELPPLVVKVAAVEASQSAPLVNERGKPMKLELATSDQSTLRITFNAGLKGDQGPRGLTGTLTPELVSARDEAVAAAVSSSADAAQTSIDRQATGSDREQTGMDRAATAADRSQTESDRLATESYRIQTGQDRQATGELRDSASGHRAAAQAAATLSGQNRDATAQDRIQTGLDRQQSEEARDIAVTSAGSASEDAAKTSSDRQQTGEDRIAAAQSAAIAASYDPAPFQAHLSNTSNPHGVTKAQVGLGSVNNTSDANKPVSSAQATAIAAAVNAHAGLANNPHGVTKVQIGLGNADNTSDANKPVSTAQQSAINSRVALDGSNIASSAQASVLRAALGASEAGSALFSGANAPPVPNNDYNQAVIPGNYIGHGSAAGFQNAPPGSGRFGTLVVTRRAGVITQRNVYGASNTDIQVYERVSADNGVTWGQWQQAVFVADAGSNSNGEYERYSDGTQRCRYVGQRTFTVDNTYGSLFQGTFSWVYPAAFISPPSVSPNGRWGTGAGWMSLGGPPQLSAATLRMLDTSNRASGAGELSVEASGRWRN